MAEEYKLKMTADTSEVVEDIKDVKEEIKEASEEQTIFSKATDKLKDAFKSLKGGVKVVINSFKTLKGAIAATGIGLLVIALGSLVAFFTKTQRGVDLLDQAMAGLGAAVGVIIDRMSDFGESITKFFSGDFSGAVEGMTKTFSGLGDEIVKDAKAAASLEKTLQSLIVMEREFSVQKAKNNVIIREAEALAADQNASLETRVTKLKEAMALIEEQALEEERIAKLNLDTITEQNNINKSLEEDNQKQAEAEIALINIRAEAADRRKALIGQLQSLNTQLQVQEQEQAFAKVKNEEMTNAIILENSKTLNQLKIEDAEQTNLKLIDSRQELNDALLDSEKELSKDEQLLRKSNTESQLQAGAQLAGALSSLAGDNKELAVASAIIDTYVGANKAFAQGGALGFISAAAVIAGGLANVRNIMQTEVKGAGGGASASIPNASPIGNAIGQAIPVNANLNDLVNQGNDAPPVQAYVISQEVTDSQEADLYIKTQTVL
jgi:hypothetical protein